MTGIRSFKTKINSIILVIACGLIFAGCGGSKGSEIDKLWNKLNGYWKSTSDKDLVYRFDYDNDNKPIANLSHGFHGYGYEYVTEVIAIDKNTFKVTVSDSSGYKIDLSNFDKGKITLLSFSGISSEWEYIGKNL